MKSFISLIIFLKCLFLLNAVIPIWDLEKAGQKLENLPYSYIAYETDYYQYHLKYTRTIYLDDNNILSYKNEVEAYHKSDRNYYVKRTVDFDLVGSFYYLRNRYYICPKGKYHLYDLTGGGFVIPKNFQENGDFDYELKCSYHEESRFFIAFYLMNGEYAMYPVYIDNDINQMTYKTKLGEELYDYRIGHDDITGNHHYLLLSLDKKDSQLLLNTFEIYLEYYNQGVNSILTKSIENVKKYLLACFRSESSKYPNDFFYITYNDLSDLKSGYSTSSPTNWKDFSGVKFQNNGIANFEFF